MPIAMKTMPDTSATQVDNHRGDGSSPTAQAGADFVGDRMLAKDE